SQGPTSPGARETRALETMKIASYIPVGVNLGFIPQLPPQITDHLDIIDAIVRELIFADIDLYTLRAHGLRFFKDLPEAEQIAVVADRLEHSTLKPVYM